MPLQRILTRQILAYVSYAFNSVATITAYIRRQGPNLPNDMRVMFLGFHASQVLLFPQMKPSHS